MTKTRIQTCIQMYDKNTHTNVWKKHAYKCMTKTRIQMYEQNTQMYDKNTHTDMHTNVWQKHAYKCMKKTGIQMYDKNTLTNTHTNVWQKNAHKCMKKKYSYTGAVDGQLQRPGGALLKGTSAVTRRWTATPPAAGPPLLFWAMSGDWTANSLVIGWAHSPLRHGQPSYKCKNVWEKPTYKCMKKTRIQIYE